jgi:hypothetical protein
LLPFLPPQGKDQVGAVVGDRLTHEGAVDLSQSPTNPDLSGLAELACSKILSGASHGFSGLHQGWWCKSMVNSWLKPALRDNISQSSLRFSLAFRVRSLFLHLALSHCWGFTWGAIGTKGTVRGTNMVQSPLPRPFAADPCIVSMSDIPTPASLSAVQSRIEDIADQAGVAEAARLNVDDTLAALP